MTDPEILDNAPEGATHIDGESDFCKDGYYFGYTSRRWIPSDFDIGSRSLADIKRIVELEKSLSNSETMGERQQSIRDLEQQAKGLEDLHKSVEKCGAKSLMSFLLIEEADELINQAKALKEQVND
tara:strand:- start:477 stop:854 length:378 start_codon:yes stop_codon:yes gene_type:complete